MAPRTRRTNSPPFVSSIVNAGVFHRVGGKGKTRSAHLTPTCRISDVSNSSLVHILKLFLSPVARYNPSRQNKATCGGNLYLNGVQGQRKAFHFKMALYIRKESVSYRTLNTGTRIAFDLLPVLKVMTDLNSPHG